MDRNTFTRRLTELDSRSFFSLARQLAEQGEVDRRTARGFLRGLSVRPLIRRRLERTLRSLTADLETRTPSAGQPKALCSPEGTSFDELQSNDTVG